MSRLRTLRASYPGAVLINLFTIFIPALYGTLSKLWIAQLAPSQVVTTDVYTYVGIITEVVNEGLSRVAYNVIGNKERTGRERRGLCWTLIAFQAVCGLLLSVAFVLAAPAFAAAFVPIEVRETSITYVRIASFSSLFSVLQYATEAATRSLDRPDVPLVINTIKTCCNITLDFLFLSTFRVWRGEANVNVQGAIRLACDGAASLFGLAFFAWSTARDFRPSRKALKLLARPASFTFTESALRNGLYLWQVSTIVALGSDYATAWGVFNTIRWGVLMVPASAFEQASLVFVAHRWGAYKAERERKKREEEEVQDSEVLTRGDGEATPTVIEEDVRVTLKDVVRPAITSAVIVLVVEIVLALIMSFALIERFAYYLSASVSVAELTTTMFRQIDWCYVLFTVQMQFSAILLATRLDIWFVSAFITNIIWVLPWCIYMTVRRGVVENAWRFYAIIFGGSLVLDFFVVIAALAFWARAVSRGWRWKVLAPLHD